MEEQTGYINFDEMFEGESRYDLNLYIYHLVEKIYSQGMESINNKIYPSFDDLKDNSIKIINELDRDDVYNKEICLTETYFIQEFVKLKQKQINALEDTLDGLKKFFNAELKDVITPKHIDNEEYDEAIQYLYWNKLLKFSDIKSATELKNKQIRKILESSCDYLCTDCNKKINITITCFPKNESEIEIDGKTYYTAPKIICEECYNRNRKSNDFEDHTTKIISEQQNEIKFLKSLIYSEYLKTKHWDFVRRRALWLAKYKCSLCNDAKPLQVHHKCYDHLGEEQFHMEDVIALCANCHSKFHTEIRPPKNNHLSS